MDFKVDDEIYETQQNQHNTFKKTQTTKTTRYYSDFQVSN